MERFRNGPFFKTEIWSLNCELMIGWWFKICSCLRRKMKWLCMKGQEGDKNVMILSVERKD